MPCFCEQCSKEPRPTYIDKFKLESLARQVSKMFGERREKFNQGLVKKHGTEFLGKLNIEIINQNRRKK